MADWPTSPVPNSVSIPDYVDPSHGMRVNQGYEVVRPRYSRGFRRFLVQYRGLTSHSISILLDFAQRVTRNHAYTFGWTYPQGNALVNVLNTTPIVVQTGFVTNIQTNDAVVVSEVRGTTAANNAWFVTVTPYYTMTLVGSAGNGAWTGGGIIARRFNTMRLVTPSDALGYPEKLRGPYRDNLGLFAMDFVFEEVP